MKEIDLERRRRGAEKSNRRKQTEPRLDVEVRHPPKDKGALVKWVGSSLAADDLDRAWPYTGGK